MAHRISVVQAPGVLARRPAVSADEPRPDFVREAVDGGLTDSKRPPPPEPRIRSAREKKVRVPRHGTPPPRGRRAPGGFPRGAPGPDGNEARDVRPRADAAVEVALGDELLVRVENRKARDPELGREGPRRGNSLAGPQPPAQDRLAKPVVELPVQRRRGPSIDGHDGNEPRWDLRHAEIVMAMQNRAQMAIEADRSTGQTRPAIGSTVLARAIKRSRIRGSP